MEQEGLEAHHQAPSRDFLPEVQVTSLSDLIKTYDNINPKTISLIVLGKFRILLLHLGSLVSVPRAGRVQLSVPLLLLVLVNQVVLQVLCASLHRVPVAQPSDECSSLSHKC